MSTIKDTTVTMGGLSTFGNQLSGKPDGSLNDCDNVVLRQPGVLEPAPYLLEGQVLRTAAVTTIANLTSLYATAEADTQFVSVWGSGDGAGPLYKYWLSVYDLGAGFAYNYQNVLLSPTTGATRNFFLTPGDAQASWSRNRRLYSSDRGCMAWTRNTANTDYELRLAGMPAPKGVVASNGIGGTPSIYPNPGVAAYRATLLRKYVDYTIESSPTPSVLLRVGINITTVNVVVHLDTALDIRVGDIVVLYKTASVDDPDGDTNPGDDMQEALRVTLAAADLTAGFVALTDTNRNSSLGASLYTSLEGLTQSNAQPPNAHDVCTFGDTTFYAMTQDYPSLSFSIPNLGPKAAGAAVGNITFNVTTAGVNANTGTIPGDQTQTVLVGMLANQIDHPTIVSAVSYNGTTGLTTVTVTDQGRVGYYPYFVGGAGVKLIIFSDTWTITINEYDGSTTTLLYDVWMPSVGFANQLPVEPHNAHIAPDPQKALVRLGITRLETTPNPGGTTVSAIITLSMTQPAAFKSFTLNATHGNGYMLMNSYTNTSNTTVGPPAITTATNTAFKASVQSTDKATLYYSKSQLPESVPPGNFFPVGHGEIQRLFTDQNSLYAVCTDGLYRITGVGNDWTVVQLSRTFRLVSKNAVTSCLGTPFVWGLDGISAINESGARNVSTPYIGPALSYAAAQFTPNVVHPANEWPPCMTGDDSRQEVTLQLGTYSVTFSGATGSADSHSYGPPFVLNLTSLAFYKRTQIEASAMVYQPKWRMTLYFNTHFDFPSTFTPLVAWEERPGEIFMNTGSLPVYQNITARRYPTSIFWIFNPFKAQASVLKQWIDCNVLIRRQTGDGEIIYDVGPDSFGTWYAIDSDESNVNAFFRFVFSNDELAFFTIDQARNWQYATPVSLPRQHCDIPRRVSVGDTLTVGCQIAPRAFTKPVDLAAVPNAISYPRFRCEGFTLRYRVASDTFQI